MTCFGNKYVYSKLVVLHNWPSQYIKSDRNTMIASKHQRGTHYIAFYRFNTMGNIVDLDVSMFTRLRF